MEEKRIFLYQGLVEDGNYTKDYDAFVIQYFSNENAVRSLWLKLLSNGEYTKTLKNFFEQYACDLPQFSNTQYCKPQSPVNPTPVNPTPVNPTPVNPPSGGSTPGDNEHASDNPKCKDNKVYQIPGDPFQWCVGEDGNWWSNFHGYRPNDEASDAKKWINISGGVDENPRWNKSIRTLDSRFPDARGVRTQSKNNTNESITLKLGKFFLD